MGIVNRTPDSFFPGSRSSSLDHALEQASEMAAAGADILDIGGESSRPGSSYVEIEEELERVVPTVTEIRKRLPDILISVDTRKARVAASALDAGADMINDISALSDDSGLAALLALRKVPVVLMHMRGNPKNMQLEPMYEDTVAEVADELMERVSRALSAGISAENIIIDPGIGFGKRSEDNLRLIKHLRTFKSQGFPVLIGLSRKGFIGKILDGRPVEGRAAGTLAALAYCVLEGADILRVHDVQETADLCRILLAIRDIR